MSQKILNRYEELIKEANFIQSFSGTEGDGYGGTYKVLRGEGEEKYREWRVKTKNLLRLSCGENSVHYKEYVEAEKPMAYDNDPDALMRLIPILKAAYDDLKNGFLVSFKQIVQAEVFDSELEQAKSLLDSNYKNAAAVIAGAVLETAIKELCNNNQIDIEKKKLTRLNDDLAKAGVYNVLQQKQITALADIRNNAAHGKYENFSSEDVQRMIQDIERFLLTYSNS